MYQCSKQKKDCVLCHERLGKSVPAVAVVHVVKDAFLATTQVVEFNDISGRRLVVVGQDAAVGVFSFPQIKIATGSPLSLDNKTIAPTLPFLNETGIELKLDAVDLLSLPSPKREDVIVERAASVCTDVEVFAMLLYLTDDFFRAGSTIGSETIYTDVLGFQKSKESLMGVCLIKAYICVAVAVLDIDNLVTDDIYTRPVAEEFLVCRLCIIFLSFKELMVKINIVTFLILQLTGGNQSVDKQGVKFICSIEVIGLALIGCIGNVILRQFLDGSKDGIRTACTKHWMVREMTHQV